MFLQMLIQPTLKQSKEFTFPLQLHFYPKHNVEKITGKWQV